MKRKTKKRVLPGTWFYGVGAFVVGLLALAGCSTDEPGGPDDGLVAVEFTASVGGAALPQGRSTDGAQTRGPAGGGANDPQTYTGTTSTGVPYRDFTDADGFEMRAFYPGGASRQSEIAGASTGTSTVGGSAPGTRTTDGGDSWAAGDQVGMFMVSTGGTLPGGILSVGGTTADNRLYNVNPGTGALTPDDAGALYYPQSGNVDFIAYYPHTGTAGTGSGQIDNYIYHLTVDGQTDEAAQNGLDVLYAKADNGGFGYTKSKTPVDLQFGHVLSKVTLNVSAGDGIEATGIQGMTRSAVEFRGMPGTATLDLQNGGITAGSTGIFNPAKASAPFGSADATFTALVVPQAANAYTGRTVVFTLAGVADPLTWTIPDTEAFEAGQHYIYPVSVTLNGISVGIPTINQWTPNPNTDGSGEAEIITPPFEGKLIKAGTFQMGSPVTEPNRSSNETLHAVTLTKDFYMGKYPVTFTEYDAFCDATSRTKPNDGGWGRGDRPVIYVSWDDAVAYCEWLSQTTGMTVRLPTEAEWEYACRGGQTESLPFGIGNGKYLDGDMANINGRYIYDMDDNGHKDLGSGYGTYLGQTSAVGQYDPNGYGLYDMHGNVFEWCSDWYGIYDSGSVTDPTGPDAGINRVLRGGSWSNDAQVCRSAYRSSTNPDYAYYNCGFRVVFVP